MFSVSKKVIYLSSLFLLASCGGISMRNWGGGAENAEVTATPTEITESTVYDYGTPPADTRIRSVSVLLPTSGPNSELGNGVKHAIEIAFLQKQPKNIMLSFQDLSGTPEEKEETIRSVIATRPDMIIGPIFSEDVEILKGLKPVSMPAITFTSVQQILGDGIFTMALLPNQAVETIVKQMAADGKNKVLIIAPDTRLGYMLANNALQSTEFYDVNVAGLYYYDEGASDSMRTLSSTVSLNESRTENVVRARTILSNIYVNEDLTVKDKEFIKSQIDAFAKTDSLGDVPYNAVLFLGNAQDSKTIAGFLRFYDVPSNVTFYGTALWDTEMVYRDLSLSGGKYAALPNMSDSFSKLYSDIHNEKPDRFDTLGYDTAMLAIKSLSGDKTVADYLLDPSGYNGLDGLVRLRPNGENERALQVMQLNGIRKPIVKKRAEQNFVQPIYKTSDFDTSRPRERDLTSVQYDVVKNLQLPEGLAEKYSSEDFLENNIGGKTETMGYGNEQAETVSEDDTIIKDDTFKPAIASPVIKKSIDEVQMKTSN